MSGRGRVLVVDDSQSVRRAVGRMLAPIGLAVDEARDGDEARRRLARERPRLVICDVVLPGADGYEVCRFVRGRPELAGVPVLLITGRHSAELERRAAASGAAGVLAKPFTAKSLIARVEEVLAAGGTATPAADDEPPLDLLAGLDDLPGVRASYAVEPDTGRLAGGEPAPAAIADLVRLLGELADELGLGEPLDLSVEGDAGSVVVRRSRRTAVAVCFDRGVLPGQARYRVRRLFDRTEPPTPQPSGARHGNHSR